MAKRKISETLTEEEQQKLLEVFNCRDLIGRIPQIFAGPPMGKYEEVLSKRNIKYLIFK